jgi:hypothetical protein
MTTDHALAILGGPRCKVAECDSPHLARGLCNRHWKQSRGPGAAPCACGCGLVALFGGYKPGHGKRINREAHFWAKVDKTGDCWNWLGLTNKTGYGKTSSRDGTGKRQDKMAHRLAYELAIGPIPDGLTLDHLCCNMLCCRPDHLEPVTRSENARRARLAATTCPKGHPYGDAVQTERRTGPSGPYITRVCPLCRVGKEARRAAAQAARRKARRTVA